MPTFKCSGENWSNSSCYFPSHKWVFFKILHQSLVSWKILFTEETKSTFLRNLSAWIKIHQILDSFETTNQFFFKFLHQSSVPWDTTPLYFLIWNFIYFTQKSLSRYIFGEIESLKFRTLMCSFCQNNIKFQPKKYRRVISHDTEEWCKV